MASLFDFIRAAALVVGLGYTAQQDRKAWIWGDSVLWGAYALGLFFFPGFLFPGNDSALLTYVIRVFAAHLLGMETMWYLTQKTRDGNVIGATLWSRFISSMFVLILLAYSYTQKADIFSEKTLYFDMLAYTMLLLTTVYQFWRGEYRVGGREQKGSVSHVLRIIFLIMFVTGLLCMAFPTWVLPVKRLEYFESLGVKCVGAMLLGQSFIAWYATSFKFDEDRSSLLLSYIVAMGLTFVSLNMAYFVDGLFSHQETLYLHLGMLPALLVMLGLYLMWRKDSGNHTDYNLRSRS